MHSATRIVESKFNMRICQELFHYFFNPVNHVVPEAPLHEDRRNNAARSEAANGSDDILGIPEFPAENLG